MGKYWLTPLGIYQKLDEEFHFDFDPCPCPKPENWDALRMEWGKMNYVNPPFRPTDGNGNGPTAFIRKAIEEHKKGNGSVILVPAQSYVNLLLEAGAELRSMGRVKWLEIDTMEPMKGPSPITCFILRSSSDQKTETADYVRTRDLTDEEWLKLPKEEILQLYKNCYSMLKQQYANQPTEDFPDIDFRRDIANELSRDELIERLCEMNKTYTEMRKEWFEKTQLSQSTEGLSAEDFFKERFQTYKKEPIPNEIHLFKESLFKLMEDFASQFQKENVKKCQGCDELIYPQDYCERCKRQLES
jgi:hypothetical protein